MAPIVPFISDEIYTNLTGEESVHLAKYPVCDESMINETFDAYNERSLDNAKEGSLGVRLTMLPFPMGILSKTVFGQMLPFPCWSPLMGGQDYAFLSIEGCTGGIKYAIII